MPESGSAVKAAHIDNAFAASQNDLYANKPFYGAVFRAENGHEAYIEYVKKEDRITLKKWLDSKDIKKGSFLLKTNDQTNIPFTVDKNAESNSHTAANPFLQNLPAGYNHGRGDSNPIKEELEIQNKRLSGNLSQADRKNRELLDELERIKRELSKDNSTSLLTHQKEINELKDDYRDRIDAKKEEIQDLKHEIRLKELERNQGDRSVGNRLLDILQSNLGDGFLKEVAANVAQLMKAQGNPGQPTQAQLQQAMQQAGQMPQFQQPPETPGAAQENTGEPARVNLSQFNTGGQTNEENATPPKEQTQSTEKPQQPDSAMKKEMIAGLKTAAMQALTAQKGQMPAYINQLRSQVTLLKQNKVDIDAKQWIEMAKMLATKAVDDGIKPDRVVSVISPVIESLPPQVKMGLKFVSAKDATNQLFKAFNIEAGKQVKNLIVKVIEHIKNN